MFRFLRKKSSRGAALVEYAVLIGVVAVVVLLAVVELGRTTVGVYETSTVALVDAGITDGTSPTDEDTSTPIGPGDDLGGPGDDSTPTGWPGGDEPTRPILVDEGGCLTDAGGSPFWCGEGPFEVPGEVDVRVNDDEDAIFTPFYGAMCAYNMQTSSFFTLDAGWGVIYSCIPPESDPEPQPEKFCTLERNDYSRYDEAWGDRSKEQVTQDNDMYCEPDPTSRGEYRAVPGAVETYVLL